MNEFLFNAIVGFPGTGKTKLAENYPTIFVDIDDAKYSKTVSGLDQYLGDIKDSIGRGLIPLVSMHEEVRRLLHSNGIKYIIAVPCNTPKAFADYMECFKERGSSDEFCSTIRDNWDDWLDELNDDTDSVCIIDHENLGFLNSLEFIRAALQLGLIPEQRQKLQAAAGNFVARAINMGDREVGLVIEDGDNAKH